MPKLAGKHVVLSTVLVGAYLWYVWAVVRALDHETDEDVQEARLWDRVMRSCYAVSRRFGQWGMNAEARKFDALERGRMN